jgi:hypothetical protein
VDFSRAGAATNYSEFHIWTHCNAHPFAEDPQGRSSAARSECAFSAASVGAAQPYRRIYMRQLWCRPDVCGRRKSLSSSDPLQLLRLVQLDRRLTHLNRVMPQLDRCRSRLAFRIAPQCFCFSRGACGLQFLAPFRCFCILSPRSCELAQQIAILRVFRLRSGAEAFLRLILIYLSQSWHAVPQTDTYLHCYRCYRMYQKGARVGLVPDRFLIFCYGSSGEAARGVTLFQ